MSFERLRQLFICSIALWFGVCAFVPSALAEAPTEVAVITPDPAQPLALRVAAELRQLGLRVIFVRQPDAATMGPASLEAAAQGVGAFAAVRVVRSGSAVEVWIADRTTGKTVVREVVGAGDTESDAEVALGAVELLRASLLELNMPERAPHGDVEPAPEVLEQVAPPPPPPPPPPRAAAAPAGMTTAALGVALDPGVRGFEPGYGPQVLVAHRFGDVAAVEAMGSVVFGAINGDLGTRASTTLSFVGVAAVVAPSFGRVEPRLGAGLGYAHLQTQGVADMTEPVDGVRYFGDDPDVRLAVVHLRSGLAITLFPTLRWRLDATLLAAANEVTIRFANERVATWGRPSLLAATSLELAVR